MNVFLRDTHEIIWMLFYIGLSEFLCSKTKRLKMNQIPEDSSLPPVSFPLTILSIKYLRLKILT